MTYHFNRLYDEAKELLTIESDNIRGYAVSGMINAVMQHYRLGLIDRDQMLALIDQIQTID